MFTSIQRKLGQGGAFLSSGVPCLALAAVLAGTPCLAARDPVPSQQIPLAPLGYMPVLPEFLAEGSSMMSVHFAGKEHLLVTFAVRRLIPREVGDPPDDYDRLVGAFYIDLSSGAVLAKTEWRLHDRGQYLWDLGNGRFLLRVRDRLSLLDPLRAATPAGALKERPFLRFDRRIVAINVSPEDDILTVESSDKDQVVLGDSGGGASITRTPVQMNFYRLLEEGGGLIASSAGTLRAPVPLAVPMNSGGYLDAIESKRDNWKFRFNSDGGKAHDLAAFDTTCAPHPMFVSRSEFVAFGCMGSGDRQSIGGFSLNGDFMWQQSFSDSYVTPNFEFAPDAGRFAIGRTLVAQGAASASMLTPSTINGQEIRVYQTYNGKVLLRLTCAPAVRAGQNFALSPDGMKVAVLREAEVQHKATKDYDAYSAREATVDVFDLPPLNKEDKAAVSEARQFQLPGGGSQLEIAAHLPSDRPAAATVDSPAAVPEAPQNAIDAQTLQNAADSSGAATEGDIEPSSPRKPPTLYAPGEKPDANPPQR